MDVHRIDSSSVADLESTLTEQGFALYLLDGQRIIDKSSFFAEASRSLPMGDSEPGHDNLWRSQISGWDAFADFLTQGLANAGSDKIAILWQAEGQGNQASDFSPHEALAVISDVADDLRDLESGMVDRPVDVRIFLIGSGPDYLPFDPSNLLTQID